MVCVEARPNTAVQISFISHTLPMGSESDSAAESLLPAVRRLLEIGQMLCSRLLRDLGRGPRASREALLADSDESPKALPLLSDQGGLRDRTLRKKANPQSASALLRAVEKPGAEGCSEQCPACSCCTCDNDF